MDVLSQYQDVVESVLGAVHPDAAGRANSAKLGYDVVALEVNLANASPDREDMDDITVRFLAFLPSVYPGSNAVSAKCDAQKPPLRTGPN